MPYLTLKVLHLVAIALTFMGLAGALASNAVSPGPSITRRIFAISHGLGLLLLLITGFLLLIQLGIGKNLPGWVWGKVIIWLLAGVSATLVRRFPRFQVPLLVYLAVLVGLGAWLALYKPFLFAQHVSRPDTRPDGPIFLREEVRESPTQQPPTLKNSKPTPY